MRNRHILTIGALLLVAATGLGFTVKNSAMVWTFLHGPTGTAPTAPGAWNTTWYDTTGIPKTVDAKNVPTNDLLTRIANALPEQKSIVQTDPDLISGDFGANVHLAADADVYVTFLSEGAGYLNSFGFFTFQDGAIPTSRTQVSEEIVFPNASFYDDGGDSTGLHSGDTLKLGHFTQYTNVGFMVVANGFNKTTGTATTPTTGGPPGGDWIFYTIQALNPEPDPTLRAHTVLLHDNTTGLDILGMEDMRRDLGSDNDFNDVVFSVYSVPAGAITVTGVAPLPQTVADSDGDGVINGYDDFPNDATRAFDLVYPSKTGTGELAFDDNWPAQGVFDFNDLVVQYQFHRVENAQNGVVDMEASLQVVAHGSLNGDGFGLAFPGLTSSLVQTATLSVNGGTAAPVTPESGDTNLTYIFFDDVRTALPTPTAPCTMFDAEKGCYGGAGPTYFLKVTFTTPQTEAKVGYPPWDPFIYRTGTRGQEVHLANHAPTAKANTALFDTLDDNSNSKTGAYYLNFCNLPYALDIPATWAWPYQGKTLPDAYPDFILWANSVGGTNTNWYLTDIVTADTWTH